MKTDIVAGLGALSTLPVVADAFMQHGGLTLTDWLAAIVTLVTATGFATMRAAISSRYGKFVGMLLQMFQRIALRWPRARRPL